MEDILKYWPIVFPLLGVIAWGARLEGLVKGNRELLKQNSKRIDMNDTEIKHISKISEDVVEIKTNMQWVKKALQELKLKK